MVSKSRGKVVPSLEAEDGTLGVRISDYPLILKIIQKLGKPITATSANASGKKTPYSISDILENLGKKQKQLIDLILDAGRLPKNPPSTVVDTTLNELHVLRKGEIKLGDLAGKRIKSFISTVSVREYKFKLKAQSSKRKITAQNEKLSKLFHIDTWRMYKERKERELLDLGFYNMLKKGNVIVIEWLEKVRKTLEKVAKRKEVKVVWVVMNYKNKNKREIILADQ